MDVVLLSPLNPENVGSVARVMMNFDYSQLILVTPRTNPTSQKALIVSRRARSLLEKCHIYDDFKDVRKNYTFLIGTTARVGGEKGLKRLTLTIDQFISSSIDMIRNQWHTMALVLGPEDRGLTNEEASLCDVLVTIPTSQKYPALNLSHAAAIFLYLLRDALSRTASKSQDHFKNDEQTKHRPATSQEKGLLIEKFSKVITASKFREHKQPVVINAFKNILSRGYVSGREVLVLMGVFNWLERLLTESDVTTEADHEK